MKRARFPAWAFDAKDWFRFEVVYNSKKSRARVGRIHTPHGHIDTPGFVPVGTNATMKCIDSKQVDSCGVQLMFCNTYHLMVQPGAEVIGRCGGLHEFMNRRDQPLITDSGGFQVFSMQAEKFHLSNQVGLKGTSGKKMPNSVINTDAAGVTFRSYRDGAYIELTPRSSVIAQKQLRADIIIPLDHLPPYNAQRSEVVRSLELSHLWETQSLSVHLEDMREQAMYAVLHGGSHLDLRKQSIEYLTALPFDGWAVGGSLGKTRADLYYLLEFVMPQLPPEKPVHLLGIGDRPSIHKAVPLGVDTFDSSYPTKLARHGNLLTSPTGTDHLSIRRGDYATRNGPICHDCDCYTCRRYSVAYLHHLFKAREPTYDMLATIHNTRMMVLSMEALRNAILCGKV